MKIKTLAISLFASLGIGAMSALFTLNSTKIYEHLNNNDITNNYFIRYNTLNPNNK